MRKLSGLSHEEIAVAPGTSVGTAKQTIRGARRALVHGPSWASRNVAVRTGSTCKTSRDDPAPRSGTHLGVPQV
jgi:Sigma-70, region 4